MASARPQFAASRAVPVFPTGKTNWGKGSGVAPVHPVPMSAADKHSKHRTMLRQAWNNERRKRDPVALAEAILAIELETAPDPGHSPIVFTFDQKGFWFVIQVIFEVLCLMHTEVINALVHDDLTSAFQADQEGMRSRLGPRIYRHWHSNKQSSVKRTSATIPPGQDAMAIVYYNVLAQLNGDLIEPDDRNLVCDIMANYIRTGPSQDPQWSASKIKYMDDQVDASWRGLVPSRANDMKPLLDSDQRRHTDLRQFVDANKLRATPSQPASTFAEVGLASDKPLDRLDHHLRMSVLSPPTLQLAYASLLAVKPYKQKYGASGVGGAAATTTINDYKLHQFAIFHAKDRGQLGLGEAVLTVLTSSYLAYGGCNQHHPGISNEPHSDPAKEARLWSRNQAIRISSGWDQLALNNAQAYKDATTQLKAKIQMVIGLDEKVATQKTYVEDIQRHNQARFPGLQAQVEEIKKLHTDLKDLIEKPRQYLEGINLLATYRNVIKVQQNCLDLLSGGESDTSPTPPVLPSRPPTLPPSTPSSSLAPPPPQSSMLAPLAATQHPVPSTMQLLQSQLETQRAEYQALTQNPTQICGFMIQADEAAIRAQLASFVPDSEGEDEGSDLEEDIETEEAAEVAAEVAAVESDEDEDEDPIPIRRRR